MLTETATLLQTVYVQADILRRASLLSCMDEDDSQPPAAATAPATAVGSAPRAVTPLQSRLTLEAIRLLALKLSAVCLSKWLTLNGDGLNRAIAILEPTPAHGSGIAMGGGGGGKRGGPTSSTSVTAHAASNTASGVVVGSSRSAGRPAGERHEGGGSTDGPLTACLLPPPTRSGGGAAAAGGGAASDIKQPSPAADSASSTLEAACGPSGSTWIGALSMVAECMTNFGKVSELWGTILTAGGAFAAAAAEGGERESCMAAARLQAMGYEGGVWDLMGTAYIARKTLESIHNMPGFA